MRRIFCLWIPISFTPSMTFHQHQQVWQPFVVSFDSNYFNPSSIYSIFVGTILFDGQMASRKYDATASWLIWSVAVKLFLFKVRTTCFTPACICRQRSISDAIELRKLFLEVFNFLLLFLNHSSVWWIKMDIPQWYRSWIWVPTWWCCMRGCFRIFHDYAKKWGFVQPF